MRSWHDAGAWRNKADTIDKMYSSYWSSLCPAFFSLFCAVSIAYEQGWAYRRGDHQHWEERGQPAALNHQRAGSLGITRKDV